MNIYESNLEYERVWVNNDLHTYCTYKIKPQIELDSNKKEKLIEWYNEIFYPYTQMKEDRIFKITK